MKKIFIPQLIFTIFFATVSIHSLKGQTWGNQDEYLMPVSNNLVNGMMVASPPTTTIIQGDLLYFTDYYGFNVYDVSDPQNPVKISGIPLPGKATHFALADTYAYVCMESGVIVVDITEPAAPEVLNVQFFSFRPYRVIIDNETAYFAMVDGVRSYAIVNSQEFTELGLITIAPAASTYAGFVINGNYIYYSNATTLSILNVSNPQTIQLISTLQYNSGGVCWGNLVIHDQHLYVVTTLKLLIYDLTNPASPLLVYFDRPANHSIYEIVIEDNIMVLNHNSNGKWTVCDISNPASPVILYNHEQSWFYHLYALGTIKNNILYVLDNGQEGNEGYTVHMIDISNVTSPTLINNIQSMPGKSRSVSLFGRNGQKYALVAQDNSGLAFDAGLLRILNVTDPAEPFVESTLELPGHCVSVSAGDGEWAYVSFATYNLPNYNIFLALVNIENISSPYVADVQNIGSNISYLFNSNLSFYDGNAFVVSKNQLRIYKGSSGSLVHQGSTTVYGGTGMGVFANSPGFVYVAGGASGVQLYNVSNPSSIYLVNWYNTPGTAVDVYANNGFACVADHSGGLSVFDVSQNIIIPLGQAATAGNAISVAMLGDIAYVGLDNGRIQMFKISNPTQPISLGWYLTNGTRVNDLAIDATDFQLYVANELEMLILQLLDPVGVDELPVSVGQMNVFPNPASQKATIEITVPNSAPVLIQAFDSKGALVKTILNNTMLQGKYQIEWNLNNIPNGLYIVEVSVSQSKRTEKLLINR